MRVLFVCLGNICRSPTAEAVLRAKCPHWSIDSAGTASWHVGKPPYAPMRSAATTSGYDMDSLRARQFSVDDFGRFDVILGMDADNIADIEALRPSGNATPVQCLAEFGSGTDHVPDPYYTRDFVGALELIELCVDGFIADMGKTETSH